MKIKITQDSLKVIYAGEMPIAKQIIKDFKEDSGLKSYAQTAVHIASGENGFEILKADAEMLKNCRVSGYYSDDSGELDIWINVYAFNVYSGFYDIGFYLSDIWSYDGENGDKIKSRMYIKHYKAD